MYDKHMTKRRTVWCTAIPADKKTTQVQTAHKNPSLRRLCVALTSTQPKAAYLLTSHFSSKLPQQAEKCELQQRFQAFPFQVLKIRNITDIFDF